MEILYDEQIINSETVTIATSSDNLIALAITKSGLKIFCNNTTFFDRRRRTIEYDKSVNDSPKEVFEIASWSFFIDCLDSSSYCFRFSESTFQEFPESLLTFTFELMINDGQVYSASISNESHPVVALWKAVIDLDLGQSDVKALSLMIEYCGQIVFKSPKSLIKQVFRKNQND